MPIATTPPPLLGRLRRLLSKIHSVVFVVPDDSGLVGLEEDLVAMVQDLMAKTVAILQAVGDYYEVGDGKPAADQAALRDVDDLMEIGAQISTELAEREIADLAFIARGQLTEMEQALSLAQAKRQIWAIASHADTGLRRAGKALMAVESAMCEFHGQPPPQRDWVELELSLKTRRLYGRFRRAILALDADPSADLQRRLQGAAHRIATLRQLEIYPFLRIDDRVTIRALQKRIARQLQDDVVDVADGTRLWQDTVSLAGLLVQVNARAELRQHDYQALRGLCFRLDASADPSTEKRAQAHQALEVLEGLDDELDEVIADPGPYSMESLWAILHRLLNALKPTEVGSVDDLFPGPTTPTSS